MSDVLTLLWPKWRQARNSSRRNRELGKLLFLAVLAAGFCVVIFLASRHVFRFIEGFTFLGEALPIEKMLRFEINHRLLGMVSLTFFAILVFSNVITALTTFYLSDDLELVGALPVTGDSIFIARFVEMVIDSSWMIVIFGTPVYIAYGAVYGAGGLYYALLPVVLLPFILIPAGLGAMVTMILVSAFPARRIRDILLLLTVLAAGFLFLLLRLMRPETLIQTDVQVEVLDFIHGLRAPAKSWMPSLWATEIFAQAAAGELRRSALHHLTMLWSAGLGMVSLALLCSRWLYLDSFSKAQEATRIVISRTSLINRLLALISRPFRPATRQLVMKDIRTFMRDTTQWSQLFLLAALVVIYIFNFRVMPVTRFGRSLFYIHNLLSYLNIGLAGFVITALSARFVFPMVSLEGQAFWIVKSSPLSLRGFLWSKFMMSALPLLLIGLVLIVVTNYVLGVEPAVWYLSVATIVGMTFAICGLGVGLGARYPNFHAENPAKVATSFGGVIYMIVTMSVIGAVVAIEATPAYIYFQSKLQGEPITTEQIAVISGSLALAGLILVAATFIPMRIGLKWLEKMEL